MKKILAILFVTFAICLEFACNRDEFKPPVKAEYFAINGTVIGKETCKNDENQDYWLIALDPVDLKPFGNTITLNGQKYNNVMKTNQLGIDAKKIGQKLSIEYLSLNDIDVETVGCEVAQPQTFTIHEMLISKYTLK